MDLEARLVVERSDFTLDVDLHLDAGQSVALVGPNGAGKSTVLRALCGLEPLTAGRIELDGSLLDDVATSTYTLPERRPMSIVFQDLRLFPSMSALENVAFGPRARGASRSAARATARAWLDRFGIGTLADRRPSTLSGGEAQRVALARALAVQPRLLLLDEPMSALDATVRADLRADLAEHLAAAETITVLVTHDPVDVHALAGDVVVLDGGTIVQSGPLPEISAHPRTRHVADLVGLVFVEGIVSGGVLTTANGATLTVPTDTPDGPACASIRPSSIAVHRGRPEGSARNVWTMAVTDVDARADRVRLSLTGPLDLVAELTPSGLAALDVSAGATVWVSLKASEIAVSPLGRTRPVSSTGRAQLH